MAYRRSKLRRFRSLVRISFRRYPFLCSFCVVTCSVASLGVISFISGCINDCVYLP